MHLFGGCSMKRRMTRYWALALLASACCVAPASAEFITGGSSGSGGGGSSGITSGVTTCTSCPANSVAQSDGAVVIFSTTLPSGIAATNMNLTTPTLGVASGTSLALNGVALGTNTFAAAGAGLFNLNAAAAPAGATGTGVQLVGTDATVARIEVDSFGAIGAFTIRRANGTGASPTALASLDQIGAFNFHGYYVTGGPGYSSVQATVSALATQNWTSTNQGTQILLRTTPNNSTTLTTAMTIGQDQSVAMAAAASISGTLTIGSGSTTNAGWIIGYGGFSGFSGAWPTSVTPSGSNYALFLSATNTDLNISINNDVTISNGGAAKFKVDNSKVTINQTYPLLFGSSNLASPDAGISRNASGVIQVSTTTANSLGTLLANTLRTNGFTVATLPTGVTGARAYVTDQLTACPAVGAALTGGGAVVCPTFYNGSAWVGG